MRGVQSELSQIRAGHAAFDRFLAGTALDNRAELVRGLEEARTALAAIDLERLQLSSRDQLPAPRAMRNQINDLELRIAAGHLEIEREGRSSAQLAELANELQGQSLRLTRAIVAGERFFDFEFVVCPRCGSAVAADRATSPICYVCLQPEPAAPTRDDLIREQDRVNAQISETDSLVDVHQARLAILETELAALVFQRAALGSELDRLVAQFISDSAQRLEQLAARRAELRERIRRLEDYLALLRRFDELSARAASLQQRRSEIESALERAQQMDSLTASRIQVLESQFVHFVEALEIPRFGTSVRAAIDRNDYLPIVNGQKFESLSAGVRVLVNVAYILSHHRAAEDNGLPLPRLLMIDGLTKNIGTADYDAARIADVWTQLIDCADHFGDEFQIIVAVNDVPQRARQFVVLELSEEDRLIPAADVR
jgi:septal ring factor EnvC (AmiA/AmiB activator)